MGKSKYIVGTIKGLDTAVVFHRSVDHLHMVKVLDEGKATSAGFFEIYHSGGRAFLRVEGRSTSIGCDSAQGDAQLIARAMGLVPVEMIDVFEIEFEAT